MTGRPNNEPTTASAFRFLADYLDASDAVLTGHARKCLGEEHFELGDGVQRDLRTLAHLLDNDPRLDAKLMKALPQFREWSQPGTIGHTQKDDR